MAKVEEYRNFCNKLWNAARYVLMNVEGQDHGSEGAEFSLADRWIQSRLSSLLSRIEAGFAGYRLDNVANALYEFTWHEFCDWYLELAKSVLQSESASAAAKLGTRFTLINTLEVLLRALHPLAPFITEEIWQRVRAVAGIEAGAAAGKVETIMRTAFPSAAGIPTDPDAEPEMRWVMDFILGVRQIRGEMDIAPSRKLDVLLQGAGLRDAEYLDRNLHYLTRLAGIAPPRILERTQAAPISAIALLGSLEILVPMAGLIDPTAELERLAKKLRKAEIDLGKLSDKLANTQFAANAPPEVVAKDQQRLEELRTEIGQLSAQTARVNKLKHQ
jgi:valyl-tRNA synthetase